MKNKIILFLSINLLTTLSLFAIKNDSFLSNKSQAEPKIIVNNRILSRVNGKPITTYELMKKMDLLFFRQYPQYSSSIEARAQYYEMSWKPVLEEIIDKELILADATESKIEVSGGDVRQEMELSFGPNIIVNLDKAGITYDEAYKIVQEEIIIKRMISGRVHSKALRKVTPTKVRQAYQDFIQDPANARLTQWTYKIVTVKERTLQKTEETANAAYQMLKEGLPIDEIPAKLQEKQLIGKRGKVSVSAPVKHNDQELSPEYGKILATLSPGTFCEPFAHKSRANNATVFRILFLQEKTPGGAPSFKEMEPVIKDKLLDKAVDQETDLYLQKLRLHYHIGKNDLDDYLPADFQPFSLK